MTQWIWTLAHAQELKCTVSRSNEVSHFECVGKKNWKYDLTKETKNGNRVKLELPYLNQATRTHLLTWKDSFIDKIKIERNESEKKDILTFVLTQDDIESFDYLTDDPSKLIVDYFIEDNKEEFAEINQSQKGKKKQALSNNSEKIKPDKKVKFSEGNYKKLNKSQKKESKNQNNRKLASSEKLYVDNNLDAKIEKSDDAINKFKSFHLGGVFDGSDKDFNRFRVKSYEIQEDSIIASRENIYIKFPMLKMSVNKLKEILKYPPEYVIKTKKTKENQEARLLLTLFENKRSAVFLKTYDYFLKKYKDTEYEEILKYMAADVHFNLWIDTKHHYHYETATKLYLALLKKFPDSVLSQRTEILLSYAALERRDVLNTIQHFENFVKKYPQSSKLDEAQFAIAEGYMLIKREAEALKIYNKVFKNYKSEKYKIEALYRKGDVFFQKKNYKEAIEMYNEALGKYPSFSGVFPNATYNVAESYFWVGDFEKSLDRYIQYLNYFPTHEHNAYAMTRVGEILEIFGADKKKVKGAYLESFFRHQKHEGGIIARIRLISQQMDEMGEKELSKSLEELEAYKKELNLPKIKEFITLMITDGFRKRKDYDKAISYLVEYYQKNPTSTNLDYFKKKIVGNISDSISEKLKTKNFVDTLKIFDKYSSTWLRKHDRIDVPFFLARSYELAGVHKQAEDIYLKTLKKLTDIKGRREEKERRVNEHLPRIDQILLRLAHVYFEQRKYSKAYSSITKISSKSQLGSREKLDYVRISGRIFSARGDNNSAIKYLQKSIKNWDGEASQLDSLKLDLAKHFFDSKDYKNAEIITNSVLKDIDNKKEISEVDKENKLNALVVLGDSLYKQNKSVSSVEIYSQLLDKFESNSGVQRYRYLVGKILFDRDDLKGAEKVWSKFNDDQGAYYRSLANEKLEHTKWKNNYKKYINRIPAMSKSK